jgi:hypothetical protein
MPEPGREKSPSGTFLGQPRVEAGLGRLAAEQNGVFELGQTPTRGCDARQFIPCTTIARTILDVAEVIRPRQLEAVFEQADQEEVLDLRALKEQIALSPTRVGASRVKKLIDEYEFGQGVTWSDLERDFKAMIAPAAIPMPLINHFIVLSDGEQAIRRDFYWPEYGLVVETDGWRTHRTRAAVERDRRNDQRLTLAGYWSCG